MAIYSYHESNISRSQGKSACASISYITKQTIHEEGRGITHAYSARGHDVSVQLYTPQGAPEWTQNLQTFWNKVEAFEDEIAEIRFKGHPTNPEKNERSLAAREAYKSTAITGKNMIFALPREFTREQSQEVIQRFADRYFLPRGLCVTAGFHWENHNPHVHLQIAPRALEGETFCPLKNKDLTSRMELIQRRHLIAEVVNEVAKENNINIHLDARSYKDQGIDLVPTRHEGWFAQKYLKDASRIIQENQEIKQENIKILFEQPQNLLKLAMGSQAVVTRQALEGEIFSRVGGDAELWAMMSHRLSSWTQEMARQKTPLYKILSQNESLKPYLSAFGSEVETVPSQELAERLHASLPAGFKSQISVEELRSASQGLTQKETTLSKDLARELEILETSNTNVANLKKGHTLPSEEERLSLVNRFVDSLAEQGLLDRAGETVKGERVYTTKDVRNLEKRTTDALQKLSASRGFGLAEADVETARLWVESDSPHGLDSEQREALKGLTGDTGLVVLEGPAGTGKTTVLKSVTRAYESQDYRVLGMSFQGKTAAFLGEELGIPSETLDLYRRRWEKLDEARADLASFQALPLSKRLVQNFKALQTQEVSPSGRPYQRQTREEALQRKVAALERYDLTAKDVVFVDESYLSSSSSLRSFLERASEKGAKAILIGDRHQGLSIASGDLTRQARQYGENFSLETIRRQKVDWQREASQKLYDHDLWGGFGLYQEKGHVTTGSSYDQTLSHLVSDWMAHVKGNNGKVSSQKIGETLILARTNQEVETLDRRVVQALKQEGTLGDGHLVSRKSEPLQTLVHTSEKAFYETLSVCDQRTREKIQEAWKDGVLTSETFKTFLSNVKGDPAKITEAFSSLQQASAALFAEKSENTFYEGQRVSFRSNDYSNAFKIIPPWEVGNVSTKDQKALLSLDKHVKNLEGALFSLDKEIRHRAIHALLEGSSDLAKKAIVKSDHSPKIFGVYRDLKKIEAAPEEIRKTYQVFKKTPKGVRNGQEGIFLGKGEAEGSYRVQLEKGPMIEFVPETLNPRSFENHILSPAYALTYNRAQGLTKDAVFSLLGEGMANLLYVAGTRHREVFKAYYNGAERQDLKEALLRSEKSDYRPVLEDYQITEEERPYQVRVVGYLETAQKIQQTLRQIMELQENPDQSVVFSKDSYKALNPDQKTLFDDKVLEGPLREKFEQQLWDQFADLKAQHTESAREIAEDLDGHRLFLNQAHLTPKTILVAAGLEAREFSPLEKLAFHKVAAYDKVAGQTRALWEEIAETHPGALCYGHPKHASYAQMKQDRDLQAHALYTGQALVGEKLIGHPEAFSVINDPVTLLRRVMKDPEIKVTVGQMAAHHKAYLSHLAEKESFKEYEEAHEKVVAYRQVRNFAAASFKETKTVDPQILEKRDGLAFEIFEALGRDPGVTKVVKSLLSTDRDEEKLLNHAIRGEVKKVLDLYRNTPDLEERGKCAAWLGSHEEGRDILHDNTERPTALLFEAKSIQNFLSTERSLEAQKTFRNKILAWKQKEDPLKELGNLESRPEEKPLKIAVGDSRDFRQPSVDLSALNETLCNSVNLERLGRDLGLLRGKGHSDSQGKVRYGTKGSFVIDRNKNLWHDFERGTGGNAFSMLKEAGHSSAYKDKVRTLSDYSDGFVSREIDRFLDGQERSSEIKRAFEGRQQARQERDAVAQKIEKDQTAQKRAAIQDLVKKSVPLEGTQAETYLRRTRGLSGPFPESLRYLEPGTSFLYPGSATQKQFSRGAMATLSRDKDGTLKAVQVTYLDGQGSRGLDRDGKKLPKITYGTPKGAFVDLSTEKLDPKTTPIFLAEGVETGLSIKQAGAQRVMASLGLNNLKGQELEAPQVILCGDWDGTPEMPRPLKEAQKFLQEKGQGGEIVLPVTSGQEKVDFNDLLLEGGVEKVQDRFKSMLDHSLKQEKQKADELLIDDTDKNEQNHDFLQEHLHERIEKTQSSSHDVVQEVPSEENNAFKTPESLPAAAEKSPSVDAPAPQKAETSLDDLTPQEEYHLGYIQDVQKSYLRWQEKDPSSDAVSNFENHLKSLYQKAAKEQPKIFKRLCQTEDKKILKTLLELGPDESVDLSQNKHLQAEFDKPLSSQNQEMLQEIQKAQRTYQATQDKDFLEHLSAQTDLAELYEKALDKAPEVMIRLHKTNDKETLKILEQEAPQDAIKDLYEKTFLKESRDNDPTLDKGPFKDPQQQELYHQIQEAQRICQASQNKDFFKQLGAEADLAELYEKAFERHPQIMVHLNETGDKDVLKMMKDHASQYDHEKLTRGEYSVPGLLKRLETCQEQLKNLELNSYAKESELRATLNECYEDIAKNPEALSYVEKNDEKTFKDIQGLQKEQTKNRDRGLEL